MALTSDGGVPWLSSGVTNTKACERSTRAAPGLGVIVLIPAQPGMFGLIHHWQVDDPEIGDFRSELTVLARLLCEPGRDGRSFSPRTRADDDYLKRREGRRSLDERAVAKLCVGLLQLLCRVHHDRAAPRDGLLNRQA